MNLKSKILNIIVVLVFCSCSNSETSKNSSNKSSEAEPIVTKSGHWIEFPLNSTKTAIFSTTKMDRKKCLLSFSAPANVVGRVNRSSGNIYHKLILFESPEITSTYSTYIQNITLEKSAKINFDRVNDLYKHGAATGKELNDASSELLNIQTILAENEAKLREAGLNPENLNSAPVGTVWLICDLPESELNAVKRGQKYKIAFSSFPNESLEANIDVIADVMNSQTRKIRVRLSMFDREEKIRPGMYAQVQFENQHEGMMVPKQAVFSANARYFVFVKHSATRFERREVTLSSETGDYIEIAGGLNQGEDVVTANVYLLKGIALGI